MSQATTNGWSSTLQQSGLGLHFGLCVFEMMHKRLHRCCSPEKSARDYASTRQSRMQWSPGEKKMPDFD